MKRWGLAAVAAALSMGAMAVAQEPVAAPPAGAEATPAEPTIAAPSPTEAESSPEVQKSPRIGPLERVPGTYRLATGPQPLRQEILRVEMRHIDTGVITADVVLPRFMQPDFVIKAGQPVYRQRFNVPRNGVSARPEDAWCAPVRTSDGPKSSTTAYCLFDADEPGRAQYSTEALTSFSTPWFVIALDPMRAGTIAKPQIEQGPADFGVKVDLVVEVSGIEADAILVRRRIETSDGQRSPLENGPWFREADGTAITYVLGQAFRLTPDAGGQSVSISNVTLPDDVVTATQRRFADRIAELLEREPTLAFVAEGAVIDAPQTPRTLTPGTVVFSQSLISAPLTAQNETPYDRERQFGRPGMRLVPIMDGDKQLHCARFMRRDRGETQFCLFDENKDGKAERIYRNVQFAGSSTLAIASLGESTGMARPVPIGATQNEVLRETLSLIYLGRRTDSDGESMARFGWRSLPQGQTGNRLLIRDGQIEAGSDVLLTVAQEVSAQTSAMKVDDKPILQVRADGAENIIVSDVIGFAAGPFTLSDPKKDARALRERIKNAPSPAPVASVNFRRPTDQPAAK